MPKKAGRPTKITDDVINQMRSYMMAGVSLKDACELVGIGVTTWREFEQKEPNFRRKRKKWQGMLKARAKVNIAEQVFGNKEKGIESTIGSWRGFVVKKDTPPEVKEKLTKQLKMAYDTKEYKKFAHDNFVDIGEGYLEDDEFEKKMNRERKKFEKVAQDLDMK